MIQFAKNLVIIISLPAFITLHGFQGMPIRINTNTIQWYQDNLIDNAEQKTKIGFVDGNTETVIETCDQIDLMIKEQYPQGK